MGQTHLAWMIVGGEQSDCKQSCKQCCNVAWFRWAEQSGNLSQRRATASSSEDQSSCTLAFNDLWRKASLNAFFTDSSSLPADGMPWVWDYSWNGIKRLAKCNSTIAFLVPKWNVDWIGIFFESLRQEMSDESDIFSSLRSCGSFTSHSCVFFELPVSVCSTKSDLVNFSGWLTIFRPWRIDCFVCKFG